jgi:hypothetical protein
MQVYREARRSDKLTQDRLRRRRLLSVPCHRTFCTVRDRSCGPAAPAESPWEIRCRCMTDIFARSDSRLAFSFDIFQCALRRHDVVQHASVGPTSIGDVLAEVIASRQSPPGAPAWYRDHRRHRHGRASGGAQRLQPANARQRQNPLKDGRQTDQHHEQLEKICQSRIAGKLVDRPKTDGTDHDNNQNTDQNGNHGHPLF